MDNDIIEFCAPITIGGWTVAEVEGTARIVSPSPRGWEISLNVIGTATDLAVSLDNIKPTDRDCDLKAGLRQIVEDCLWADYQDAVENALAWHRKNVRWAQGADSRMGAG